MISHHLCSERVSVPTSMVSYYHQVYSHTVVSLTHSPIQVIPVNTSMVSYYHQVFSLTLTHSLSHPCHPTHTSMVSYYHQVITHPHQSLCSHSLPSTMSSHTLLPSLHFTSFSLQMHHKCITNHLPHSPTHHASIASSSLPITYHHLSPPIASSHSIQHS